MLYALGLWYGWGLWYKERYLASVLVLFLYRSEIGCGDCFFFFVRW